MRHLLLSLLIISSSNISFSQSTGIGVGTTSPHASAQLDVSSTSKGFLPPRMTYAQRNAISSPSAGLIIWCTDCLPKGEVQVYNGTEWTNMTGDTAAVNYVELPSVKIGSQVWQLKNLDVAAYLNGDAIPKVTDATQWSNLTTGAWCWYNNDSATYAATYGRLYNWYAVADPRGLCPAGWRVPSHSEWTILSNFLGGESLAGGALKSTTGWASPNTGATNSTGFTGLPGGNRDVVVNNFFYVGTHGSFWTSSGVGSTDAYNWVLWYLGSSLSNGFRGRRNGLSVRCMRD